MRARGEIKPGEAGEAFDVPEDFWDDAEITPPRAKRPVSLRVDPDIIDFFGCTRSYAPTWTRSANARTNRKTPARGSARTGVFSRVLGSARS